MMIGKSCTYLGKIMKKKIILMIVTITLTLIMGVFFNASRIEVEKETSQSLVLNKPRIKPIRLIKRSAIRFKTDQQTMNQVFYHKGLNHIAVPINIFSRTFRQDQDFDGANQNIECRYGLGEGTDSFLEMELFPNNNMNLHEHSNGLDLYAQLNINESMGAENNSMLINIACKDSREDFPTNTLTFKSKKSPITVRYLDDSDLYPNSTQYHVNGYCDSSISSTVEVTISQAFSSTGGFGSRSLSVSCLSPTTYSNGNFYRAVFHLAPFIVNPNAPVLVQSWLGSDSTYFIRPEYLNIEQRIMDFALSGY
jgi:hypothetical protein